MDRVAVPINDDGVQVVAMADPKVHDFVFDVLEGFHRFPVNLRPWIMTSIVMSLTVEHTENPVASLRELSDHMIRSLDQATTRRDAALTKWQLDPRHQNGV